jgi:hypothetical protein
MQPERGGVTPSVSNAGEIVVRIPGSQPPPVDRARAPLVWMDSMMQRAFVLVVTVRRTIFDDDLAGLSGRWSAGSALAVFQNSFCSHFSPHDLICSPSSTVRKCHPQIDCTCAGWVVAGVLLHAASCLMERSPSQFKACLATTRRTWMCVTGVGFALAKPAGARAA